MARLSQQVEQLPASLTARLSQRGFAVERLQAWAETLSQDAAERNHLRGVVGAMDWQALPTFPTTDSAHRAACVERGEQALKAGELAICVLAGGMATRMGGVVKALAGALDNISFLAMRLAERAALAERFGAAPPLWLMTSEPTHQPIVEELSGRGLADEVRCFEQFVSLRLNDDGNLFLKSTG